VVLVIISALRLSAIDKVRPETGVDAAIAKY
jgi:hypothetical protein